jgi:phenylpropionate dioxygenase-like ring-hydroxylating dioxygenase large terminal subunit
MQHAVQVENARKFIEYLESKTTAMAEAEYRNPVSQYTCPERLSREQALLFSHYPLHIGFSCEIPEPGDFKTDDFSGVPILLVRGEDGKANAFLNVCRHRGAPVAEGCGKGQRRFTCPYHAWVYGADGALEYIPGEDGFEALDRSTHGLRPLPVQEKYGMIWVKTEPGDDFEIDDSLQGVERDLATYGFEGFHHFETGVLRPKMNWKLVIDTFLESYHIKVLHHRSIAPLIESNVATFEDFGINHRGIYVRKNFDELLARPENEWNILPYTTMVYVLFPNTVLVVQQEQIETWRVYPDGDDPNASKMHVSLYTPNAPKTESATRHWRNNMDLLMKVVNEEDFPLGEKMQFGFHSLAQDHLTFGRNEPALAHFHSALDRVLAEGIAAE